MMLRHIVRRTLANRWVFTRCSLIDTLSPPSYPPSVSLTLSLPLSLSRPIKTGVGRYSESFAINTRGNLVVACRPAKHIKHHARAPLSDGCVRSHGGASWMFARDQRHRIICVIPDLCRWMFTRRLSARESARG